MTPIRPSSAATTGSFQLLAPYLRFLTAHPGALAFGFMLTFFSSFGQTFFIALFGREIRALYGLSDGEFGTIYAGATLLAALLIVRAGRQIDHWPTGRFAASVIVGLALATAMMAVLPPGQVWVLFIAIVLLRLCGQGLMHHTAVTTVARAFPLHRGQAISTVSLGFSVGEAVMPLTVVFLMATVGWRLTWGAAAMVLAVVVLPLALWLARRHFAAAPGAAAAGAAPAATNDRSRAQVLRDAAFYLLLPGMLAPAFVNTGVFFHQIPIAEAKGWTLLAFASGFTVYAFTTLGMMVVGGRLIDQTSAKAVIRFALFPLFLGLLVLAYGEAVWVAHAYMLLAGITTGLYFGVSTAVWAELYGVTHLGAIRAMTTSLMMVSTALAPSILGWLLDFGFDIRAIMTGMAAYVLVGIVLMFPAIARHGIDKPAAG